MQAGVVNGVGEFGRVSAHPFLPSGSTGWRHGPYVHNVPMSGETTFGLTMQLRYGNVNTDHGGSIWIPWAPQAPSPVGVDQIMPTSARYRFSGNGANGSGITGWQAQIALNSAFNAGVQTISSDGTAIFTGLMPSTTYYFRSRGLNGVGWGAWSSAISALTASGAYVSLNGAWVPTPLLPSSGASAWLTPEIRASVGGSWVRAI